MATNETHPDEQPVTGFDQTNGLAEGLEGDSDGTAGGEHRSAADRAAAGRAGDGQAAPVIAPAGPIHP